MTNDIANDRQIKENARAFFGKWNNKGNEKQDTIKYWSDIFTDILGIYKPTDYWQQEKKVIVDGNQKYIDIYIPETRVIIEQKSLNKALDKNITQSGGTELTPYEQAKRYNDNLPTSEKAKWIVTCNFAEIWIYNMESQVPEETVVKINLIDLQTKYHELNFLVNPETKKISQEMEISKKAGDEIGKIYDAILAQYHDAKNPSEQTLKSLNMLCVRLVFCFYAEDSGVFGHKNIFSQYIEHFQAQDLRKAILDLFQVLDQDPKKNQRDEYLDERLSAFPYVNGGLFTEQDNKIPQFNQEIKELLLQSGNFTWEKISPTIFGALFESTLNQDTRRSGGMHYTSIQNIHKVIDPLFMNNLTTEFNSITKVKVENTRNQKLKEFQQKLGSLKFFDPACGSGNFLTESFMSLRRLENECIRLQLNKNRAFSFDADNLIKVDIHQFYGIEINDFAVAVAKTALWIADSQMKIETMQIIDHDMDFLPLVNFENIVEGNALRLDWKTLRHCELDSESHFDFIMGNPPFVGYSLQSKTQKEDILSIYVDEKGKPYKTAGKIDYVAGWYFKASQLIQNTNTKCCFVSTNSITQGEQVAGVFKPLFDRFGIQIDFAYKTFRWDSESNAKAHVHCVIVGFSCNETLKQVQGDSTVVHGDNIAVQGDKQPQVATHSNTTPRHSELVSESHKKYIYDSETIIEAKNINGYLIDAPNIFVESRNKSICDVPQMSTGNRPADGGHLIIEAEEYDEFIKKEPNAVKYIKKLTGAEEYINNKKRYCLWLVGANPKELLQMPLVLERIEACKKDRLAGAEDRQKLAATPHLFREQINPENYIIVPRVSSENREYIPIGFLDASVIPTDSATIIKNATLYHFGILTSSVHMAWMRVVCGRLKSDYRYSKDIVYNNFVWPLINKRSEDTSSPILTNRDGSSPKDASSPIAKITQTAQAILDARAKYPDCSLADLYGENMYLFPELVKAHTANDNAVKEAYGFAKTITESQIVAQLFKMYEAKVNSN